MEDVCGDGERMGRGWGDNVCRDGETMCVRMGTSPDEADTQCV